MCDMAGDGEGGVEVRVVKVACGALHTVCLTSGKVVTFGWGGTGALGHGKWMGGMGRRYAATPVGALGSLSCRVSDVAAGRSRPLAIVGAPRTTCLHADRMALVPKALPVEVIHQRVSLFWGILSWRRVKTRSGPRGALLPKSGAPTGGVESFTVWMQS